MASHLNVCHCNTFITLEKSPRRGNKNISRFKLFVCFYFYTHTQYKRTQTGLEAQNTQSPCMEQFRDLLCVILRLCVGSVLTSNDSNDHSARLNCLFLHKMPRSELRNGICRAQQKMHDST